MIDYSRLALAYFEAGELVSARRNANNALALDDGAAASLGVLALTLQREQDYILAEEYFRRPQRRVSVTILPHFCLSRRVIQRPMLSCKASSQTPNMRGVQKPIKTSE